MVLKDFTTWKDGLRTHYIAVIDQEISENSYTNRTEMITQLDGFLNELDPLVTAYMNDASLLEETKKTLINCFSYITNQKINIISDPECPDFPEAFGVDGFKEVYSHFTYTLPEYTSTDFFDITDENSDGVAVVEKKTGFDDFKTSISDRIAADISELRIRQQSTIPSPSRIIYLMYSGVTPTIQIKKHIDIKEVLLTEMKFQECLDAFGWQIKGINI